MKLTIIVPIFNKSGFLPSCLDSILASMMPECELILIDDGSEDDSGEIADAYARDNDCIRVVHQSNRGVSAARNVGIKHAQGEFLTFVDADDLVPPNTFETVICKYGLESDVTICSALPLQIDAENACILPYMRFEGADRRAVFDFTVTGGALETRIPKRATSFISGCKHKFYRREFLLTQGCWFNESLSRNEDVLFSLSVYYCAKSIQMLPVLAYRNRTDRSGIMLGMPFECTCSNTLKFIAAFEQLYGGGLTAAHLAHFYFGQSLFITGEAYAAMRQGIISKDEFSAFCERWYSSPPASKAISDIDGDGLQKSKRVALGLMRAGAYGMVGWEVWLHRKLKERGVLQRKMRYDKES